MNRFRIIVAEFHSLDQFWNEPFFNLASRAFEKILQTHHCLHIHPNNYEKLSVLNGIGIPRVAEFTFLRKDRVSPLGFVETLPHPLDFDNAGHHPSVMLPPIWFGTPTTSTSLTPGGKSLS